MSARAGLPWGRGNTEEFVSIFIFLGFPLESIAKKGRQKSQKYDSGGRKIASVLDRAESLLLNAVTPLNPQLGGRLVSPPDRLSPAPRRLLQPGGDHRFLSLRGLAPFL